MNFWVCKPSIFDAIEAEFRAFLKDDDRVQNSELYLPLTIQEMLQADKVAVKVVPSDGEWFGVTYASDREKAVSYLQQKTSEGDYITPLWN